MRYDYSKILRIAYFALRMSIISPYGIECQVARQLGVFVSVMMIRRPLAVGGARRGVPQGGTGDGGSPAEGPLRGMPTARGMV